MVCQIFIEKSHLLKHLKYHLGYIILILDDVQGFHKLLTLVFPVYSFVLHNVKSNFAHLDGVELGRPWIYCFTHKAVFVSLIVVLLLNDSLGVVLVVFIVQVEEINAVNVDVINILVYRVT